MSQAEGPAGTKTLGRDGKQAVGEGQVWEAGVNEVGGTVGAKACHWKFVLGGGCHCLKLAEVGTSVRGRTDESDPYL